MKGSAGQNDQILVIGVQDAGQSYKAVWVDPVLQTNQWSVVNSGVATPQLYTVGRAAYIQAGLVTWISNSYVSRRLWVVKHI